MTVKIHLNTSRYLGTDEVAAQFFKTLEQADLLPGKIGSYEPLREPFELDKALNMWRRTAKNTRQIAGGLMARGQSPAYTLDVSWAQGPNALPGYLFFLIRDKEFRLHQSRFMEVFRSLFVELGGVFGYVSEYEVAARQHVTGVLETRLPGLFWCTAFGRPYVEWFGGPDRICSGPWHQVEHLAGGVLLYLTESPLDKHLTASPAIEQAGKEYLGVDSFGDPEAFRANPDVRQVKRVPILELPEIRVPIV